MKVPSTPTHSMVIVGPPEAPSSFSMAHGDPLVPPQVVEPPPPDPPIGSPQPHHELTWDGHPIDIDLLDEVHHGKDSLHLRGGHVLPLPPMEEKRVKG